MLIIEQFQIKMQFLSYKKIYRLGVEETEGILQGKVYIQEKVDGANTSIWVEDGVICMGSRSKKITEGFNGFCAYVAMNEPIKKLLADHPDYRLHGEWLVRHTVVYKETSYKKFYMYDISDETGKFMELVDVERIAGKYGIPFPQIFDVIDNPTEEQINKFVGLTNLGEQGEGVVLKNPAFVNKFGEQQYAKVVTQKFKEDNALVFGGNNKHSETYWEMYIINKYMTLERVQKLIHKIQPTVDEPMGLQHTPRIANSAFHDMMTEEIWEICKKVGTVDFKELNKLAQKKAVQIYKDLITGNTSVADRPNT